MPSGKKNHPKKSKIPQNPVWNKKRSGQICFPSLSQMSHYSTETSQGLFHLSSNPCWCADEINTFVKYCGRHKGGIRLCTKLEFYAYRLSLGGFWASNSNLVTCTPDHFGAFSNKIAMTEALRLPSLCPSFPSFALCQLHRKWGLVLKQRVSYLTLLHPTRGHGLSHARTEHPFLRASRSLETQFSWVQWQKERFSTVMFFPFHFQHCGSS